MSQSPMVTRRWPADPSNYTRGRQDTIHSIIIHHAASTSLDSVGQVFSTPGRGGSAHYGVKGPQVHQYVDEENTAWHCGNWPGNSCSIGIEVVNSTGEPEWLIDEETFETTVKLVADIAKRNNLGKLKFEPDGVYPTLSAHRDWSPTYCPGDYLYSRMDELAERANAINFPPAPAKAELKWTKLKVVTTYECLDSPTYLLDFNHTHAENVAQVQAFPQGSKINIYGKVENKTIGKTYLLTEWSYTHGKTTGFRETHMKKLEESKPIEDTETPQPIPEPDGPIEGNQSGLTPEELERVQAELDGIAKKAKEAKVTIPMSNKTYDILKIVAIIVLPLIQTLFVGLSKIWGFGFGEEVDQTIQLIIGALNVILGAALVKSSSDYHKGE